MNATHSLCGLTALVCLLSACVQQHTTVVMPAEPTPAPVISKPATPKKKMPVQPAAAKPVAKPAPAAKAPEPLKPLRGTYSEVIAPGDGVKAKRSMGGERVYSH